MMIASKLPIADMLNIQVYNLSFYW